MSFIYSKINCKFCKLLGVIPSNEVYTFFVIILILISYGYYLYGHFGEYKQEFNEFTLTISFIDQIAVGLLTLCNLITVASAHYNRKKLGHFLEGMNRFEVIVANETTDRVFWITFVSLNIIVIFTVFMDATSYGVYFGWNLYKFYIPRNIQFYHINVAIYFLYFVVYEIKKGFSKVNQSFENLEIASFGKIFVDSRYSKNRLHAIKDLKKRYNNLYKIVNQYNSVFGLILISFIMFTIVIIVEYTNMLIITLVEINDQRALYFTITSVSWISVVMVNINSLC